MINVGCLSPIEVRQRRRKMQVQRAVRAASPNRCGASTVKRPYQRLGVKHSSASLWAVEGQLRGPASFMDAAAEQEPQAAILAGMAAARAQRFGLPALLLAFAVIGLGMAWADLVNRRMRASLEWEAELAATAEAGRELPRPMIVFRAPQRPTY